MSNNPRSPWCMKAQILTMPVIMGVGMVFRILGNNPFDPDHLWGNNPPNIPFLSIATIAFVIALILSYTLLPLAKIETTKMGTLVGNTSSSPWYEAMNTMSMYWLVYGVFFPSLCMMEIFQIVAVTSHLAFFSWLADMAFLVAMVVDIMGLVLIIKRVRQRARLPVQQQEMEQQTTL